MRSPLDVTVPSHHSHSGSFGYNGLTMSETHSPVAIHGPSPYAAPTSPLFPSASNVSDYSRAEPTHGGAEAVDPALEDMFNSASGGSPLQHGTQQLSHSHSHSNGEDLFRSLTNGVEADEGEALGTVEDGAVGFEFQEAAGSVYPTMSSMGEGEGY